MQSPPNVIQRLAGDFTLSNKNADPDNWVWKAKSRALWQPADENWQDFCSKWYGATDGQSASLVDPKSPSLSLEPLPHRLVPTISSSIFVRKSYMTMFDTVWAKAISTKGRHGVIITGQPGTGKTLFDYYLLVRLLQRKQVVLFSPEGTNVYLFYFNEVYTVGMEALVPHGADVPFPNPKRSSNVFMWSVIDILERKEPASFLVTHPSFPVQTTSPDPSRYKTWDKHWLPLHAGLPLWTREELAQGLQYQHLYGFLLDALHKVYGTSSPNPYDPLDEYPGTRELLEERYGEEGTVPPSPEDALDYLLDAAIDRFGYSPRDVFSAVFDYAEITMIHESAFDITYADLQAAVYALSKIRSDGNPTSHRILSLSPVYQGPFLSVRWHVDFKSDWVARSVMRTLDEAEDLIIRQQIGFFRNIPEARGLAGRLLEPLAHRCIANTAVGFWPLINMVSNGADPPLFTSARDSAVPDNLRFMKVKRKIVKLMSTADLSACLENNSYYVPKDPNFPLFDAFTIELDCAKKFAILWVLQVTTSRMHGGSSMGYRKIREIIAILKDKLQEDPPAGQASLTPLVQVRYLLVVPKDDSQSHNPQWQFPRGWSQNWKKNDHRGEVYCLEVPLAMQ